MAREFYPCHDWVLIEPIGESVTEGGIVMPETMDNPYQSKHGIVRSVGPGSWLHNGTFIESESKRFLGSEVLYLCVRNKKIKFQGVECDAVRDTDVMGGWT